MSEGMKIISIAINNTRKIKAFFLRLDGNNMHIAGPTGTGKTTATNVLFEAFSKKADSLTHGEKKGSLVIRLGNSIKTLILLMMFFLTFCLNNLYVCRSYLWWVEWS